MKLVKIILFVVLSVPAFLIAWLALGIIWLVSPLLDLGESLKNDLGKKI